MSTQINQYIAYGFYLDYKTARNSLLEQNDNDHNKVDEIFDRYHDNAFKSDIVEIDGCSIIPEHMTGECLFFGKIFAKSADCEYLSTMTIPKIKASVKKNVIEKFVAMFGDGYELKPELKLITLYR